MNYVNVRRFIRITKIKKKTSNDVFKNMKVDDVISLSIPIPTEFTKPKSPKKLKVKVTNLSTGEVTHKYIDSVSKALECFETVLYTRWHDLSKVEINSTSDLVKELDNFRLAKDDEIDDARFDVCWYIELDNSTKKYRVAKTNRQNAPFGTVLFVSFEVAKNAIENVINKSNYKVM